MKSIIKIAVIVALMATLAAAAYGRWYAPYAEAVLSFQDRYQQVNKGMSRERVIRLIGADLAKLEPWQGDRTKPTPFTAWWDEQYKGTDESQQIHSAIRYTIDSPVDKISFEFTFDQRQCLVGRHRYE